LMNGRNTLQESKKRIIIGRLNVILFC